MAFGCWSLVFCPRICCPIRSLANVQYKTSPSLNLCQELDWPFAYLLKKQVRKLMSAFRRASLVMVQHAIRNEGENKGKLGNFNVAIEGFGQHLAIAPGAFSPLCLCSYQKTRNVRKIGVFKGTCNILILELMGAARAIASAGPKAYDRKHVNFHNPCSPAVLIACWTIKRCTAGAPVSLPYLLFKAR